MTLSVVIPTWAFDERRRKICMASLDSFKYLTDDAEMLFIDNGSERLIPDAAWRFPDNVGYANAVNKGLELATGDYLAVGSADVIVTPYWSEPLRDPNEVRCPVEFEEPQNKRNYRGSFYGQLWVMPRAAYEAVGPLDNTFQNFPDRDYAIRLRKAGFPIKRIDTSVVHHIEVSASWDDWEKNHKKAERARFIKKYGVRGYGEYEVNNP